MCKSRRLTAGTIAVLALLCVAVAPVRAQVMDQVPSDAWVVIKVNNLQKTSGKISDFVKQIGMAQIFQALAGNADPLAAVQQKMNVQAGLDAAGDLAVVVLNPMPAGVPVPGEPPVVILLPVTDYKAFLGNFADAKTDGGVTTVNIGGGDTFIANWGKYAALAPKAEILARKPAAVGLKLQGLAARQMDAGSAGIYVNLPAIRTMVLPMLQNGRGGIMANIEKDLKANQANQKFLPLAKVAVSQALNVAEGFLQTAESVTQSIDIRAEGISSTTLVDFAPNSYMARQLNGLKGTDGPLLGGLGAQKFLIYGGGVSSPVVAAMLGDLLDPVIKEVGALGPDFKPALDYVDALRKAQAAQKSGAFGLIAPTVALGQGSLIQVVAVTEGDAAALKGAMKTMTEAQGALMKTLLANNPDVPADAIAIKYSPNAKVVGGVPFDEMIGDFNIAGNDRDAMQIKQAMAMIYGPDGQKTLIGAADANHLVTAMGLDEQTLAAAVVAAKAGRDVLSGAPTLKAVDAQLPRTRLAAVYLPIDQWVRTGLHYAKLQGFNMNLQLPDEMSPVGLTLATEGSALRGDCFIPADLVQALVAAGLQAQQMMMQPRGGGMPPALPPDMQGN